MDVGNLNSGSSAFSKVSLNIRKFTVHILLKPGLENCEHYFASVWDECSCVVVWTFFGIDFLWDWNENWPFLVLWSLLSFPTMLAELSQHHLLGFEIAQTQLSNFIFTFHFHALEKEMAAHSSVLVWRIPGTGEPGGLPSMGSHRVGHDWSDLAAAAAAAAVSG